MGFPGSSTGKESACNARDLGSIPGLGISSEDGNDCLLQYSGQQNPIDYVVHGVTKSWSVPFSRKSFSRGSSQPGIKPRSPALQADSLPAEPQEKPKNTGVGSLSFLQRIFLTQELNPGLLHCRQILYQLSYQGIPYT